MKPDNDINVATNADRIRGMTDEELAGILANVSYCQNKPECEAMLNTAGGIISDTSCYQCALEWLKTKTEDAP